MITPSKAVRLQQSALGQAPVILAQGVNPRDLVALYHDVGKHFASVDDFMLALDMLYVLGRLNVDLATRTVTYAG